MLCGPWQCFWIASLSSHSDVALFSCTGYCTSHVYVYVCWVWEVLPHLTKRFLTKNTHVTFQNTVDEQRLLCWQQEISSGKLSVVEAFSSYHSDSPRCQPTFINWRNSFGDRSCVSLIVHIIVSWFVHVVRGSLLVALISDQVDSRLSSQDERAVKAIFTSHQQVRTRMRQPSLN